MLKGKKIGVIVATAAIIGTVMAAPAMAYSARFLSRGVESGYYGSTLENRAYQKIQNGSYDLKYKIAMRDRKGTNRGWKTGYVYDRRYEQVKVTSCWVDRSYGTNGTIHVEVWEL